MELFIILVLIFTTLMLVRNQMTYTFMRRANAECYELANQYITEEYNNNSLPNINHSRIEYPYKQYDLGPGYSEIVFSFTKWRYRSFFPDGWCHYE